MSSPRRSFGEADRAGSGEDLRERTLAGVRWITACRVLAQLGALGSAVVVAHLVSPADFGRAAVALAVWSVATALTIQGFGTALVERDRIERPHLEAAAAIALIGGFVAVGATVVLAEAVIRPLIDGETAELTVIVSLGFLVGAVGTVPTALLSRRLDFRQLAINEVVSQFVTIAVTLGLAFAGVDALAIVLGALAGMTATTGMAAATAPGAVPRLHGPIARELFRFAGPVQGASFLYAALRYSGVAIVGAVLSSAAAGLFQRAYSLGMEYQSKISSIMLTVAFPVYARADSLAAAIAMRRRIVRVHATALFPLLLLLAAEAPVLVPWVYGEAWREAVPLTQWIAIAGLGAAILTGTGPIVMAAGRPQALLKYNLGSLVGYVAAILVGASLGLEETAAAVLAFNVLNLIAAQYFLLGRTVGIPFRELALDAGPAACSGVPLLLIAAALTEGLDGAGVPAFPVIAVASAAGLAAYAAVLRLAFPAAWADAMLLLARVTGGRRLRRGQVSADVR